MLYSIVNGYYQVHLVNVFAAFKKELFVNNINKLKQLIRKSTFRYNRMRPHINLILWTPNQVKRNAKRATPLTFY